MSCETTVLSDSRIEGVHRLSADPSLPRPHVGIVGAVHGDEPCGLRAIQSLLADAQQDGLQWRQGTLVLIHGNPPATEQGIRCTSGGTDLNRLFDWEFLQKIPRERWTVEHWRAAELRDVLEDVDALVDLHSTSAPTPPFAVINDVEGAAKHAAKLGVHYLTHGWFAAGLFGPRSVIGALARHGRPAVGLECGRHDGPETNQMAYRYALRFAASTGVLAGNVCEEAETTWLRVFTALRKPSVEFRFARPFQGFERLDAGTWIGGQGDDGLRVEEDCWVLMPNDRVDVGDDLMYLATLDAS